MAKKNLNSNSTEQVNRKHAKKSRKLEKREDKKKNKKVVRKELHGKKAILKFLKKTYKAARKDIDFVEYDFNYQHLFKMLTNPPSDLSIERLFELLSQLTNGKAADLSKEEDKFSDWASKLFVELKFSQSLSNLSLFKIGQRYAISDITFFLQSLIEFKKETDEPFEEEEAEDDDDDFEAIAARVGNNSEFINRSFYAILKGKQAERFDGEEAKEKKVINGKDFLAKTLKSVAFVKEEECELDNLLDL